MKDKSISQSNMTESDIFLSDDDNLTIFTEDETEYLTLKQQILKNQKDAQEYRELKKLNILETLDKIRIADLNNDKDSCQMLTTDLMNDIVKTVSEKI